MKIIINGLCTRCGYYEVPGMILLQTYLYTYNLLRRFTFKVLPLSSYAISPMMLPLVATFLELLLWNSFHWHHHFFLRLQYSEIFIPSSSVSIVLDYGLDDWGSRV
jgi:hypothetical protein